MIKHLFVINPVSGGTDKQRLISAIESRFHHESTEIWKTTGQNDQQKLSERIKKSNPEVIILAGGDGTINQLVMNVLTSKKTLAIIPSGSANGLATDLEITIDNCLEIIEKGKTSYLDIVMVNDHPMIHMADLGLNATLVKRYEEENRRGFMGYAVSAIKELPAINQQFQGTIQTKDHSFAVDTSFLVIANSQRYGTGFEINHNGKIDDGEFEICIMNELSLDYVFGELFRQSENQDNQKLFEIFSQASAEISLSEKINFQIDGEYVGEYDYLKVQIHPEKVQLIIP